MLIIPIAMYENAQEQSHGWWSRWFHLYYDGFRSMTVGRTLWAIILLKLVVFFVVLRMIFFPDFLSSKSDTDEGKAEYVREQLTQRDR